MLKTSSECKINNQTILKEHIDEHYEPTDEEIREYALYIGIDPEKESELLWLAREGLMKPLPSGWKACQDENGELYYFNFDTGKSSWDHPYDDIYKARVVKEREKRSSIIIMPDTHSKGKNTSSLSDLSSEKNPSHFPLSTKNKFETNHSEKTDSEDMNSDPENELMISDEQNQTDFQKNIDFGIDRKLSASIEEENQRKKLANLAAQAAERRLHLNKSSNEEAELVQLRTRLEQSINDEKLQLLEDHRRELDKLKQDLASNKEREERSVREKYENDLKIFEKQTQENFLREQKFLETRQINQLNILKQTIEKEKLDLQAKLRADMLADLKLEQQNNTNIQIQLLQMKTDADEKYRSMKNRYKTQIDELNRCCEKIKAEKETFEKRLKEKNEHCLTLQRTLDQLRVEKKLSEFENSRLNSFDDEISTTDQNSSVKNSSVKTKDNDDDDGLSDTDSDVIQMNLTLNQLKHFSIDTNKQTNSIDFSKLSHPQFGRSVSYEKPSNSTLIDSGRWSNTLVSSMTNAYLSSTSKNPFWQSQPSLITREAVLKAARDVLPPGVIDHLTSTH